MTVQPPAALPENPRRLVIYVVYDRRGGVEEFVQYALAGMRGDAEHILAVVNGPLDDEGRARLEGVSDEILVRENVGFDIWAHKEALDHLGDRVLDFDELLMTNDTWFGPVHPYRDVFERMSREAVHFWGMTDHPWLPVNEFTNEGDLPYHLQSFWIAVRRDMFGSEEWKRYWEELPPMPDYFDAVLKHEVQFTKHFTDLGFVASAAFPAEAYPTEHPALFNADLLLVDGCPLVKRRPFFHYPPFLDRHAVIGRRTLSAIERAGYPTRMILKNLARNTPPRTLNANLAMLEVLPDVPVEETSDPPLRLAVVVHCSAHEPIDEVFERIHLIQEPFDLFVTVDDAATRRLVEEALARRPSSYAARVDIRSRERTEGRDMSALLVDCVDVFEPERYELLVKVHSRVPRKRGENAARYFARYQLENLLSTPGYFLNLVDMFRREEGLGAVFPPAQHIGTEVTGRGWFGYHDAAKDMCKELGINVPPDGGSPLAPLGGMWVGRPDALRLLVERGYRHDDYGVVRGRKRKSRVSLDKLQERILPLAMAELGFHCRTVLNHDHAGTSYGHIAYKLDQLSVTPPGYPLEQIQWLHRAGFAGAGGLAAMTRMYMRINHPDATARLAPILSPFLRVARGGIHAARQLMRRDRTAESGDRR